MSSSGNDTTATVDDKMVESPSPSTPADSSLLGPWLTLPVLSQCCGVAYLFCWSAMYYPQLYLNFKRKSVQGFSLDLWLYNLSGFLGYAVYNCFRAHVQKVFDLPRAVKTHDVVFSVHGLICNILIGLQIYYYERGGQKISKWTWIFVVCACAVFLYLSFLAWLRLIPWDALLSANDESSAAFITPIQFLGTIKVIITFVKYIPQIIMNHRRKSTAGLAIQVPMMDIGGALFSGLQNILDAVYHNDIHIVTGNLPKMLIGTASSLYGLAILFQHFVLYRASSRYEPVSEVELGSLDVDVLPTRSLMILFDLILLYVILVAVIVTFSYSFIPHLSRMVEFPSTHTQLRSPEWEQTQSLLPESPGRAISDSPDGSREPFLNPFSGR